MKTNFTLVILGLGPALGLIAYLAGFTSLTADNASAAFGGVFSCGLVLMAFSDYSYKPRFRLHRNRPSAPQVASPAASPPANPVCDWTYTTLSA